MSRAEYDELLAQLKQAQEALKEKESAIEEMEKKQEEAKGSFE